MIDFATSMQKTRRLHEPNSNEEIVINDAIGDGYGYGENPPAISDAARRLIALRPAFYLAMAFSLGGFLGWLTSKR